MRSFYELSKAVFKSIFVPEIVGENSIVLYLSLENTHYKNQIINRLQINFQKKNKFIPLMTSKIFQSILLDASESKSISKSN